MRAAVVDRSYRTNRSGYMPYHLARVLQHRSFRATLSSMNLAINMGEEYKNPTGCTANTTYSHG